MKVIDLSSADRQVLASLNAQSARVAQDLGMLRARFLTQEAALLAQISSLNTERENMIRRVAPAHIPDGENMHDWTFDMGTQKFSKKD